MTENPIDKRASDLSVTHTYTQKEFQNEVFTLEEIQIKTKMK